MAAGARPLQCGRWREEAPNSLTIDAQDRWGASLADVTQRVLSRDLLLWSAPGGLVLTQQPATPPDKPVS